MVHLPFFLGKLTENPLGTRLTKLKEAGGLQFACVFVTNKKLPSQSLSDCVREQLTKSYEVWLPGTLTEERSCPKAVKTSRTRTKPVSIRATPLKRKQPR